MAQIERHNLPLLPLDAHRRAKRGTFARGLAMKKLVLILLMVVCAPLAAAQGDIDNDPITAGCPTYNHDYINLAVAIDDIYTRPASEHMSLYVNVIEPHTHYLCKCFENRKKKVSRSAERVCEWAEGVTAARQRDYGPVTFSPERRMNGDIFNYLVSRGLLVYKNPQIPQPELTKEKWLDDFSKGFELPESRFDLLIDPEIRRMGNNASSPDFRALIDPDAAKKDPEKMASSYQPRPAELAKELADKYARGREKSLRTALASNIDWIEISSPSALPLPRISENGFQYKLMPVLFHDPTHDRMGYMAKPVSKFRIEEIDDKTVYVHVEYTLPNGKVENRVIRYQKVEGPNPHRTGWIHTGLGPRGSATF